LRVGLDFFEQAQSLLQWINRTQESAQDALGKHSLAQGNNPVGAPDINSQVVQHAR
jgi:hypothetical protein